MERCVGVIDIAAFLYASERFSSTDLTGRGLGKYAWAGAVDVRLRGDLGFAGGKWVVVCDERLVSVRRKLVNIIFLHIEMLRVDGA